MIAKTLIVSALIAISTAYPLFTQCDVRWKNDIMGTKTICAVGCLMSSVSMVLNDCGKTINGGTANPKSLNQWL
jgi:hypothetical protein